MDKFFWSFDKDAEIWCDTGDSIDDCIAQARAQNANDDLGYSFVYIGECAEYVISIDPTIVLEYAEQMAYEEQGEAAEDWESFDYGKQDELQELEEQLNIMVTAWLKKYGHEPNFCSIIRIKKYDLTSCRPDEEGEARIL